MSNELITLDQIESTLALLNKAIFSDAKELAAGLVFLCLILLKKYIKSLKDKILAGWVEENTKVISDNLAMLCGKVDADRAIFYIFKNGEVSVTNAKLTATPTHEAVRAGIASLVDKKTNIVMKKYGTLLQLLIDKDYLIIKDITTELKNDSLKSTYQSMGVTSVAKHIIKNQHDQIAGFISVEYVSREISYDLNKLRHSMELYAIIIGNSLSKKLS